MVLEILISTMHRKDMSFLNKMFANNTITDFQILIINQTTKADILRSELPNVRVINSFEKGLSKSRNLAIDNALGDICLIADDDVEYVKDFDEIILSAFKGEGKADIITFQMVDEAGRLYNNYPNITAHNKKTVKSVNSVVIALKPSTLKLQDVRFNEYFGLGATFQSADEYVFLRNALRAKLKVLFKEKIILSHKFYSSGKAIGSDRVIYAFGGLCYKYSGVLAYSRLMKHLLFIFKKGHISFQEIMPKYRVGVKAINEYKRLLKLGLEKR